MPAGRQEAVEGAQVLLGQGLGGHEDRGLRAGLDGLAHGEHRHQRLARADLPLEQAPHRPGAREVARDLPARRAAGPGSGRTAAPPAAGPTARRWRRARAPRRCRPGACARPRGRAGGPRAPPPPAGAARAGSRGASAGSGPPPARRPRPGSARRSRTQAGRRSGAARASGRARSTSSRMRRTGICSDAGYTGTSPRVWSPSEPGPPMTSCVRTAISRRPSAPTLPRRSSSSPGCRIRARCSWLNQVAVIAPLSSCTRARTRRRLRRRVGRTEMSSRRTRTVTSSPALSPASGRTSWSKAS